MTFLIFGTSITWGAWDSAGGWAQRLKSFADHNTISSNFIYDNPIYCLGISGETSTDLVERFDLEMNARIAKEESVVVIIEIGINDSQFSNESKSHLNSPEGFRKN